MISLVSRCSRVVALCRLHITRRDLVPEREFDVTFCALNDPTLVLNAL